MNVRIWIITLFPEYFQTFLQCGVVGRSLTGEKNLGLELSLVNLRDFAVNKYKSVDDYPYGGGPGMIIRADVLKDALIKGVARQAGVSEDPQEFKKFFQVIYPSPRGPLWDVPQCKTMAQQLEASLSARKSGDNGMAGAKELVFICGRYEGLDERFIQLFVDQHICMGNYILSGGEIAVMAILDSALRYVPGILGNEKGPYEESFEGSLLEGPQYTKPRNFEGIEVPEVLLSGHHIRIEEFKKAESCRLTKIARPDLWEAYERS